MFLRRLIIPVCIFFLLQVKAQNMVDSRAVKGLDNTYLEDQFYAGLAYNFITDLPANVVLRNLSYNLRFGFVKDLPLNAQRNFGLGVGFGYDVNSYYTNMVAEEINGDIGYRLTLPTENINRTKLETHAVEFPLEIRWRTSNSEDYKFWRIYGGVKSSYVFSRRSKTVSDSGSSSFSNTDVRNWQHGLTLSFGYNTWNIQLFYALNPLLEDGVTLNTEPIALRPLRVGVVFYIL
ncbi:Hypothetical protein I595_2570 [Croceitalea dokdonensis DOKDO 023]|uniref:Outer membrane protein beta-barrel domain-containing protein n=2 Tax=Croceitalea TaxID=574891 RepID=A0A0P7ASB8_9FLAO|nr:Hypothetical protein I595_2570 [Croceitalea dokdonensis DOKDO 023]